MSAITATLSARNLARTLTSQLEAGPLYNMSLRDLLNNLAKQRR